MPGVWIPDATEDGRSLIVCFAPGIGAWGTAGAAGAAEGAAVTADGEAAVPSLMVAALAGEPLIFRVGAAV